MRSFKITSVLIISIVLTVFAFGFGSSSSAGAASRVGFGFNGQLGDFPTGAVTLTGGGAYDPNGDRPRLLRPLRRRLQLHRPA